MQFSYDRWIDQQAEKAAASMREFGRRGRFTASLYVVKSDGSKAGDLVFSDASVAGTVDVVRFPVQGSNVMAVPHSHLRSLLWSACRSLPILPVT